MEPNVCRRPWLLKGEDFQARIGRARGKISLWIKGPEFAHTFPYAIDEAGGGIVLSWAPGYAVASTAWRSQAVLVSAEPVGEAKRRRAMKRSPTDGL